MLERRNHEIYDKNVSNFRLRRGETIKDKQQEKRTEFLKNLQREQRRDHVLAYTSMAAGVSYALITTGQLLENSPVSLLGVAIGSAAFTKAAFIEFRPTKESLRNIRTRLRK